MTPPRRDSDRPPDHVDNEVTPPKGFSPAEDSAVSEFANIVDRLGRRQDAAFANVLGRLNALESGLLVTQAKAEETSVTLFRAVPKRWRLAAVLGTLLGTLGIGSAGTGWAHFEDYRKQVEAEAIERKAAADLADATKVHLAVPHVDPNAAAKLAIALDGLATQLAEIDARLERLEQQRTRSR